MRKLVLLFWILVGLNARFSEQLDTRIFYSAFSYAYFHYNKYYEIYGINKTVEQICGNLGYECINIYKKRCDNKHYIDCNNIGKLYGLNNDFSTALKYYEITCDNLNSKQYRNIKSESCHNIAVIYHKDKIYRRSDDYSARLVGQDYHKALKYYKKSCDLGYAKSCNNLAIFYENGFGTRQDKAIAKQYYQKACDDLDYVNACFNLGSLHYKEKDIKQKSIAKHYYGKTCDLGEQLGCDNYKKLNEIGVK